MPNHIKNLIAINSEETSMERIMEIFEAIKNEDAGIGSIDFNKIIPTPPDIYQGNLGAEEEAKYGEKTWLHFNTSRWNTKWPAYDFDAFEDGSTCIGFNTAWSSPNPILQKLSEMFPDAHFKHLWSDEDFGFNCGEREYQDGEISFENIPVGGSKEAYELASEVREVELLELGLRLSTDGSTYLYCEDDEYELIELFEHNALFTNERIGNGDIPTGLYCYDLRHGDDGNFVAIEPHVAVNHGGTVITDFPLDFGDDGYITFDDNTAVNFTGEHPTLEQYIQGDYETLESQNGGMKM
jgi:hypothetical protein